MNIDLHAPDKSTPAPSIPSRRGRPGPTNWLAVAAIVLVATVGSLWWATRTQSTGLTDARTRQLHAATEVIACSAEAMMASDQLSALHRLAAEAARTHAMDSCRILLGDGGVIADADPSRISVQQLPSKWPEATTPAEIMASVDDGYITLRQGLVVAGRGGATLEITAPLAVTAALVWPAVVGIGGIGVAALLALWLIWRKAQATMRAMAPIREALLADENGPTPLEALRISPELGPEARAWNKLLDEKQHRQRHATMEHVRESAASGRRGGSDLSAACDAMSQGLIVVDDSLHATYANGAAGILLKTNRENVLGKDVSELIGNDRVVEAVRAAAGGPDRRRAVIETQPEDDAGSAVLRFIVRPVRHKDRGAMMIVIEDITQQRVADAAKNAFLANATHELRTPLTNIRLYVETALDEGENDPSVRSECLNIINQESRRLERLVGDILSVSEIEAGSLRLKNDDVRLDALFAELQADYGAQAKQKQIDVEFNLPLKLPVIQGDRDKISLALHNLIGNALKYTPAGGRVTVTVTLERSRLVVEVADTGIGISQEDSDRIFEKFYRAQDQRVEKIAGSGLGLAIAREVIRLHGGDITVESEPKKGSSFTLTLATPQEAA